MSRFPGSIFDLVITVVYCTAMGTERFSELRRRRDMCGVIAVQSVAGALLHQDAFLVPRWVWNSRLEFITKNRALVPDDKKEFVWVKATLKRLQREFQIPLRSINLERILGIPELITAVSGGAEAIIFGSDADYRIPHMYHSGHIINGVFGSGFESLQQATDFTDLTDFLLGKMNGRGCNGVIIR